MIATLILAVSVPATDADATLSVRHWDDGARSVACGEWRAIAAQLAASGYPEYARANSALVKRQNRPAFSTYRDIIASGERSSYPYDLPAVQDSGAFAEMQAGFDSAASGDDVAADRHFVTALQRSPRFGEAWLMHGVALYATGSASRAARAWRRSLTTPVRRTATASRALSSTQEAAAHLLATTQCHTKK
ncbi:MAG TPA: hypothetical protein VGU66_07580 [Candidatus Elarobacter sp.]|nr:hypothetical protein [Candidatus Elarobacter sp.]